MTKKRILFVGCSHTADSGFTEENQLKYHWPWLLSNRYDCYFQNAGLGGMSNDEIYYRCSEIILSYKFDLVVVMWSSIGRKWVYFEENNVDEYTIINYGHITGLNEDRSEVKKYTALHYSHFDNKFVEIKHWLIQSLSLAATLQHQNTPFIFIKGSDNYLSDILDAACNETRFGNLSENLKTILDLDNRPDLYIIERLMSLKALADKNNQSYWFNFDKPAFFSEHYTLDLADDGVHLGKLSNQKLDDELQDYLQDFNF
jgi:hypothetical protein